MVRAAGRWWLVLGLWALSGAAQAQTGKGEEEFSLDDPGSNAAAPAAPAPTPAETAAAPELLGDEQALAEEQAPDETFRESTDPYEDPKKSYFFVGAAWRYVIMPKFALEWFLDSAPVLGTAGSFMGEFGYRRAGFQVTAQVGWMKWNFAGPFQLAGDPDIDTEWLDAKFNFLLATAALTWSTAFTDWFAIEYGVEGGFAAVIGNMIRSEAYRKGDGWAKCPTYNDSPTWPQDIPKTDETRLYCDTPIGPPGTPTNDSDENGAHYNVKAQKGIANQGIPGAVPVLGPRVSLRFKPIHQLVIRVDVPLPLFPYGFVGGLAAQFGF